MSHSGRRYGYYRCDCGRTWTSAYTWCKPQTRIPKYAQDCQRCKNKVWANRIEFLKVPTHDRRTNDLSIQHKQELCHRCKHLPLPCSMGVLSQAYFNTQSNEKDLIDNYDSDNDEDDDLFLKQLNIHNISEVISATQSHHSSNSDILDLCSNSESEDHHSDNHEINTNVNNDNFEFTQYTEPQSAIDLMSYRVESQYTQPQSPQSLNISNRIVSNNRKRSRNEMESESADDALTESATFYNIASPVHKKRKRDKTVDSIAIAYGWQQISAINMKSFKKGNQRLNVWVKTGKHFGFYSMRIQPMGASKKNISLQTFEDTLSGMKHSNNTEDNEFILTQYMRDRIEFNRLAALQKRKQYRQSMTQEEETNEKENLQLTEEQKQLIARKRQQAIERLKAWRAKQAEQPPFSFTPT